MSLNALGRVFHCAIRLILPAWRSVTASEILTCVAAGTGAEATFATVAVAAEATILAWFRFIHVQISTVNFLAIELRNSRFTGFFRSHFHEAKTP
jgi:hypothetical protein